VSGVLVSEPHDFDNGQLVDALRFLASEGGRMLGSEPFAVPWPPQWSVWDMELMKAAADRIEAQAAGFTF
jgi:hypothetical protein